MANKKRKEKKVQVTPERVFIYALGMGAVGGALYFAREYYFSLKNKGQAEFANPAANSGTDSSLTKSILSLFNTKHNDSFPLKRGSAGNKVTLLQQGVMSVLGAEGMKKYTAIDGKFGPGTAEALKAAGFPTVVYEDDFNRITAGQVQVVFNPQQVAQNVYSHARSANPSGVLSALKQVKDTGQYSLVNDYYKKLSKPSRTIVTDLLNYAFKTNDTVKNHLKTEFTRMGLKQDLTTNKWSLTGLGGFKDIITIADTYILDQRNNRIRVKKNTILGDEQSISNGLTFFKAIDNTRGAVPSQDVKYLSN